MVLYTVQSRTWTNRMYVDAKFILPGSVKMQHVHKHHFAACSQRLKSPLNVTMRVTVCLDGWSTTNLSASYTQDVCLLMSCSKIKNPTFVLELSQLQQNTAAIFLWTI